MTEAVGRNPQYEVFADEFLDHARAGFFNAHWDRPACLALLGDVNGLRVLDAGCGPGLYAEALVGRGADVVAFDQSPRMVELSRERVPTVDSRVHDFADPLDWLPDASVDLVLCALALDHVDDRVAALRELRRVLRPGGALVVSRTHPIADWLHCGGSYYDARLMDETWEKGWHVRYWIAPLEQHCAEFADAGFFIERIVEPRPQPEAEALDPERYERAQREPWCIAFRLVPR
jgi:ubiquinone/menaquinone biosynthesis C-methylase UbiE